MAARFASSIRPQIRTLPNFGVAENEIVYGLDFGRDAPNDKVIGEWLPGAGKMATLTGGKLTLHAQGRDRKGPCNAKISKRWKIEVTGEI